MQSLRQHIPQPPHSVGQAYQGLRSRIDPEQIPSPIDWIQADQEFWSTKTYLTLPGDQAPLAVTDYLTVDQGNSSPRFIRLSTWNFPSTSNLASECQIPLSAMIQPFAEQDPSEEEVPLVDFGESGPPRCSHCRSYINPWCQWVSGGTRWKCNLCERETEVAPEYFCNLDANLLRLDHLQRPELNKGTVDFAVFEEYWAPHAPARLSSSYHSVYPSALSANRKPQPMNHVFALDVSAEAIQSGFTESACTALRDILYGGPGVGEDPPFEPCFPSSCHIAIFTFDRTLHFYDLSPNLPQPHMLVVPDIDEPFVPLCDGFFADPMQSRTVIESLLETIPRLYADTITREAAMGAALRAGLAALAGRGGQIVIFQSVLPSVGPGALHPRGDESALYDTDKEVTLFAPRDNSWRNLAEECAEEGIGVSMFLGMNRFIDVGSIGVAVSMTGGEIFYHPRFEPTCDASVMTSQLRRLVTRMTGYNCMMRVRCSNGIRISGHYGNFYQRSPTDLEFGTLDADKAISVSIDHSRSSLDERRFAFIQCAVLYTTVSGQRRVRTCNLAVTVASLAGNIFRFADMEATVCHMMREALVNMASQKLSDIRDSLTEKCSAILLAYRRNCAAATAPSQLILPEAFKLLPLYTLAILKSKPFKGRSVSSDVRNYYAHWLLSTGVQCTMRHLYPRMLALHDLNGEAGLPDPASGHLKVPSFMRDSYLGMEPHGMYLIDNEQMMLLWIGSAASPQLLKDLFDVEDAMNLEPHLTHLPHLSTLLSVQIRNILAHRRANRGGRTLRFLLARQNIDGAEIEFSDMLVEDQNNAALSYVDSLCFVHKQISNALINGTSLSTSSRTPW